MWTMTRSDFLFGLLMLTQCLYRIEAQGNPQSNPSAGGNSVNGVKNLVSSLTQGRLKGNFEGKYDAGIGPVSSTGLVSLSAAAIAAFGKGVKAEIKGVNAGRLKVGDFQVEGKGQGHMTGKGTLANGFEMSGRFSGSLKPVPSPY